MEQTLQTKEGCYKAALFRFIKKLADEASVSTLYVIKK
jgi:hypothetical protein